MAMLFAQNDMGNLELVDESGVTQRLPGALYEMILRDVDEEDTLGRVSLSARVEIGEYNYCGKVYRVDFSRLE
jgi:hypothetical protein